MVYRVCKSFEIESGHMLSKHPGLCRYPHGHSRKIEVVIAAETLDASDMVCDFKALKLALNTWLDRFDHAMLVNSTDPTLPVLRSTVLGERIIALDAIDPTTEAMAKHMYDFIALELAAGKVYHDDRGNPYRFPAGLKLDRVRVTETSSSWAEYGIA